MPIYSIIPPSIPTVMHNHINVFFVWPLNLADVRVLRSSRLIARGRTDSINEEVVKWPAARPRFKFRLLQKMNEEKLPLK